MNRKPRILVVDDDARMTRTLADILSASGYVAVQASSGTDALEQACLIRFDCVISDVRMPGLGGVELYRQLRQAQPGLPVVLMTAYAADDILHQALAEGVVGVFEKPLDVMQLLSFLSSLAKNCLIAVVDDDPVACQDLDDVLTRHGFNVTQVAGPHVDAEDIAADTQAILLDVTRDTGARFAVLKDIRESHPSLPVLLVAGEREDPGEVMDNAVGLNPSACLYRPLAIPALVQMLSQIQTERLRGLMGHRRRRAVGLTKDA